MKRNSLKLVSLLGILLLSSVWLFGQAETGVLVGTVTDSTGAVVANAKVTVVSTGTNASRSTVTDSRGDYVVTTLKPGAYQLTIDASGFAKFSRQVQITVGSTVDASVKLSVTGVATTVEVTASGEVATVNTESSTLSDVVTTKQISDLPTLTRDPYDLVATASNVSPDNSANRGVGYSINGQRSSSTNILLDGGENVDEFTTRVGQTIPLDSVQEFSVLTNNFSAEYGRSSGGIVNVVTKSGTNQFHGGAYEYNRVSALSSNTYQNDATDTTKGVFTRNQFGFSIGGPVIKNKLFFFSNTEWIRVRSNAPTQYNIIDPASIPLLGASSQAYFSQYGKLDPGVVVRNSGPCIPGSIVTCDAITFPVPGDAGGGSPQNTWMTVARVDYNWTDKTTLFVRYAAYDELDFPGTVNASPYVGYNTGQTNFDQNVTINFSHIFGPSLVNTFKVVYNRLNGPVQGLSTAPVSPTLYIDPNVDSLANGLQLIFPGYSETAPGNGLPFGGPQNLYQVYDDLSWTKGRHQFKFGGNYIQTRDNRVFGAYENPVELLGGTDVASGLANLISGNIYQFQGAVYPQGKYPCPKDAAGHYQVSSACTLQLPVGPPAFNRNYIYNDWSIYGMDSWKVSPKLTVTGGLRWEYYGVQHNANQALDSNFVFGPGSTEYNQIRNGSVQLASNGGVFWNPNYNNFAPRVGLAYDVFGDGRTSLRAGYGISYERNFGNVTFNAIQNPPNYAVVSLISNVDVPFNQPVYTDTAGPLAGTGTKFLPAVSQRAINQHINTAYAETWDVAIDQQLTKTGVVSIDYAGAHGVHLYDIANVNPASGGNPNGCGSGGEYLGDPRCANRLNYQYSNMNYRSDNGYSFYNAVSVVYKASNIMNWGLYLNAGYTWSHSLDNLSSTFSEGSNSGTSGAYQLGYLDAFNPKLNYGNSDFDTRHRFVVSGTWDLPWMTKSSNAIERNVLGGWSIGAIVNVRTGQPYTIYDSTNFNGTSQPLWIPNQPFKINGYANQSTAVAPNTFNYLALPSADGVTVNNLGASLGIPNCTGLYHTGCTYTTDGLPYPVRNNYWGPGYWNINMNFYKTFKLTERFNLQFRSEFYNIFNHHNMFVNLQGLNAAGLATPFIQAEKGGVYGIGGQPTDERRNIQFALKLSF